MSFKSKSRPGVQQTAEGMLDKASGSLSKRLVSRNGGSKRTEAYLVDLAKRREELARNVSEVPPSPPHPSQDEDEAVRAERINSLRCRVHEAWNNADGNPADGKWVFLTHLLRMGVTSGRGGRWVGARADLKVPEPIEGWVNAETEAEWNEWEKKDRAERAIKEKVENWKKKVEPPAPRSAAPIVNVPATKPPLSKVSDRTETTTKVPSVLEEASGSQTKAKVSVVKAAHNPLKDAAPFGFSVVKKHAQVKGKPTASGKQKAVDSDAGSGLGAKGSGHNSDNKDAQPPAVPASQRISDVPESANPDVEAGLQVKGAEKNSEALDEQVAVIPPPPPDIRHISDVPESVSFTNEIYGHVINLSTTQSFLPPSFPSSVILTSTPKPDAKPSKPRKPEPIPHIASAPPTPVAFLPRPSTVLPPSSPRITKTYGRHNLSPNQSLEVSASLPAIPLTPTRDTSTNANNKRVALEPPASPSDGRALKKTRTMPTVALPTSSMDIQAQAVLPPSPHTPKTNPPPIVQPSSSPLSPMPVTPTKKPAMPTLTDLLASAKKGKSPKGANTKPRSRIAAAKPLSTNVESPIARKTPFPPIHPATVPYDEDNPYMLDPYAISAQRLDPDLPVDIDLQSPTKSLSSLAGSDSEDDDDDLEDPGLNLGGNELDMSFNPVATSTQRPFVAPKLGTSQHTGDSWASVYEDVGPRVPASSANSVPYVYNSQFESDVAKQVDRVDKLLEKDVDYDGWLKDPEEEEGTSEDVGGFGQNSLGVRSGS